MLCFLITFIRHHGKYDSYANCICCKNMSCLLRIMKTRSILMLSGSWNKIIIQPELVFYLLKYIRMHVWLLTSWHHARNKCLDHAQTINIYINTTRAISAWIMRSLLIYTASQVCWWDFHSTQYRSKLLWCDEVYTPRIRYVKWDLVFLCSVFREKSATCLVSCSQFTYMYSRRAFIFYKYYGTHHISIRHSNYLDTGGKLGNNRVVKEIWYIKIMWQPPIVSHYMVRLQFIMRIFLWFPPVIPVVVSFVLVILPLQCHCEYIDYDNWIMLCIYLSLYYVVNIM